jgi:fructokinase
MGPIVVCGEALMDVFDAGATARGQSLDARIGGSPLNVAIGLARLGRRVAFAGAIGRGFLGERLLAALHAEGVDTTAVARVAAPTTLGLVGLDAQGVADYAFYGAGAADRQFRPEHLVAVPEGACAYQFGSYTMLVSPVAQTLRRLVEREHRRSAIAYDVNVRLNVEPDLAIWRDTVAWMARHTTLLKLSDEDCRLLYPGQDPTALAAGWLHDGVALVVLTRGAEGATAWGRTAGEVGVAPVATTLVDTVGAGDTFQAATLAALAEHQWLSRAALAGLDAAPLAAVLNFAARAAAVTCSRRGADLPRRAELGAV